MTKREMLILLLGFGGVILLYLVFGTIWAGIQFTEEFQEEDFQVVAKGRLIPGISSGKQAITDPYERHVYEFSGKSNQFIKIHIHPFLDVYVAGWVFAEGYAREIASASADTAGKGELGDDLSMVVHLPETKIYQIVVDMTGSDIGDYEVQVSILSG